MKLKSIFKKKKDTSSNPIPETSNLGISTPSPPPITHPSAEQQAYTNDDSINETVVTDAAIKDHSQHKHTSRDNNDGYRKSRKASNASSDDYKPTRDNDRRYEKKPSSSSDDNKRERKKGNREKGSERSSKTSGDRDRDRKKGREKGSERKSDRKKGRERGEERKSRKNSKLVCSILIS